MRQKRLSFFTALALAFLAGCAVQNTNIRPVGRGKIDASVSFGGPIVAAFGTHIPVPYLTTNINYGLTDRINLHGEWHWLPLAYGLLGADFGATWFPLVRDSGWVPTLGLSGDVLCLMSLKSGVSSRFRGYPVVTPAFSWKIRTNVLYTGLSTVLPLTRSDYDGNAAGALFSPFVGFRWQMTKRLRLTPELKVQGINLASNQLAVEYIKIGGYGALTPLLSLEWSIK